MQKVIRLAPLIFAIFLMSGKSNAVDVQLPTPPEGGRNEIQCAKLTSHLLYASGYIVAGHPSYKIVPKSDRVDECPPGSGEQFQIPAEPLRHYQLTLRWNVYDAQGALVSTKLLPPYYLFAGPAPEGTRPKAPMMRAWIEHAWLRLRAGWI